MRRFLLDWWQPIAWVLGLIVAATIAISALRADIDRNAQAIADHQGKDHADVTRQLDRIEDKLQSIEEFLRGRSSTP